MDKIYGLVCPISGQIRYVGKTTLSLKSRLTNHIAEAVNKQKTHKQRWISRCLSKGLRPSIWLLEEVGKKKRWQDREIAWIAKAKSYGFKLTNQAEGGEGMRFTDPEEIKKWKRNLAAAMKEVRSRPDYKRSRTDSANKAWASSRPAMMAAFAKPETKAKHSARASRCWNDPETRKRLMNRWTPEARQKQAALILERAEKIKAALTPEVRAKQGEKMKLWWAENPDHGKKCNAAITPEGKKRHSEAMKRRWADYRQRKQSQ